jgi:hypothetical protein
VRRPLLGIVVGTAIATVGFWLALFLLGSSVPVGLTVIGVSVAFSMVAVAGFGGEPDPFALGIKATIAALLAGSVIFVLFLVTGSGTATLLLPAVTLGVGGSVAHPGDGDPQRITMRMIISGVAAVLVVAGGLVTVAFWAMLAPLVPLPALAAADWITDRSKE